MHVCMKTTKFERNNGIKNVTMGTMFAVRIYAYVYVIRIKNARTQT